MLEFVICNKVSGNGFAIIGSKEFSRCMPYLPSLIRYFAIKLVFECSVALAQLVLEFRFIGHSIEIEGPARVEDYDLFREVAIVRIIETV